MSIEAIDADNTKLTRKQRMKLKQAPIDSTMHVAKAPADSKAEVCTSTQGTSSTTANSFFGKITKNVNSSPGNPEMSIFEMSTAASSTTTPGIARSSPFRDRSWIQAERPWELQLRKCGGDGDGTTSGHGPTEVVCARGLIASASCTQNCSGRVDQRCTYGDVQSPHCGESPTLRFGIVTRFGGS